MEALINRICSDFVNSEGVGAGCLVFKDNKELYSGFFGHADRENSLPMERDSIYRLFSLTKPVTSAAAMILMDKGLLSPDDSVSKFFPEYAELTQIDSEDNIIPCPSEIKISHLLSMTSGLPYANDYNNSVRAAGSLFHKVECGIKHSDSQVTTEEFTRSAAKIPLSFTPGEHWDYGISADVLGGIIEKIADMSYGDFLRENIFAPLDMDDTGFYVPAEKRYRFTALYKWDDSGLVRDNNSYLGLTDYSAPPAFESGGAGLCSTIDDYSRFARMLCNKGELDGVRIMSEKSFAYMTSPMLSLAQNTMWDRLKGYNYSCLMRIMTDPLLAEINTDKGEFGWDGWTGTYFNANPENGVVTLFFTQIAGAGTTRQAAEISRAVYDKLVRRI